jgi:predicted ATP-grasp superfamily ATP-dependent carboligase
MGNRVGARVNGSALVTDGDERAALAVVRALGSAGIRVTVGSTGEASLAGSSRYCSKQLRYPSPLEDGTGFQELLQRELKNGGHRVLIPMADITNCLVGEARSRLEPLVALPISSQRCIERAQDKGEVLRLARELGVPCPATLRFQPGEDLSRVGQTVGYPAVIKPRFSRFRNHNTNTWVLGPVEYACNQDELQSKLYQSHACIPEPLIQEELQGEGRGVFLLIWDGELKGAFCHRRLREKPPWGGVSVYRESMPLDENLVEKSLLLLQALGWKGVAMVEYKVDARDGVAKLMEVNGRFWGSLQLAIDSGINFPLSLYRLACGENVPAQFDYKVGVRSRWLLGDLDHLLIRLKHPGRVNGLPQKSKLRACLDFLKFREPDLHYEIFRLGDPGPGWFEIRSYMREGWRKLSGNGTKHAR